MNKLFCEGYAFLVMVQFCYSVIFLLSVLACASTQSEDQELRRFHPLPSKLHECSGMETLGNDLYIGTNDSGNPAELYVFSLNSGEKTRMVKITGASNSDWEELAGDDTFIYIGDTGNNSGNRKDLKVYKVKKADLINSAEAKAEIIFFDYPEQVKFNPSNHHNFDCEALVCIGDSLYLFTKNRGNGLTDVYSLPKTPGNYSAKHLGAIVADGLVTGADYRTTDNIGELALVGYNVKEKGYHPFVLYFQDVAGTDFLHVHPKCITFTGKLQTETILFFEAHQVYITNEEEHGDEGYVYRVDLRNCK